MANEPKCPLITHSLEDGVVTIFYYGSDQPLPSFGALHPRLQTIREQKLLPQKPRCWVQLAPKIGSPGWQEVASADNCSSEDTLLADVAYLTKPGCLMHQTADCASIVMVRPGHGLVLVHAGRPALTPDLCGHNVITKAMAVLDYKRDDCAHDVKVWIGPHISAEHFGHSREKDATMLEPFDRLQSTWTDLAIVRDIAGGKVGIDLGLVIEGYFKYVYDVPEQNITWTRRCTYTDEQLTSCRQWRETRESFNTTLIVWHPETA